VATAITARTMNRLLIAIGFALALPGSAAACSCSNGGPRSAAARAHQVYLGRVVNFKRAWFGRVGPRYAQVEVTLPVKGVRAGDTATVSFVNDGSNCSAPLFLGLEYLIYAVPDRDNPKRLTVDFCGGSQPAHCAGWELKSLGIDAPLRAKDCRPSPPPQPSRPAT
jgi:hypothetical protein